MEGYIDEYGQARVDVDIIGRKKQITMDPVIDTGFDGDLCLPLPTAIQLGLELSGSIKVELADGAIKRELVFSGSIKFGEETKDVEITLTNSEDALLGTGMFSRLEIDWTDNMNLLCKFIATKFQRNFV